VIEIFNSNYELEINKENVDDAVYKTKMASQNGNNGINIVCFCQHLKNQFT